MRLLKKLSMLMLILILALMLMSCSNLATVEYKNAVKDTYSEDELASLIASIQSRSTTRTINNSLLINAPLTISAGDRVVVDIADGDHFSGVYEINLDGMLNLPFVSPLFVIGKTVQQVEIELRTHLINQSILKPDHAVVSCRIQQWSAVRVLVSGAVFSPGAVVINNRSVELKNYLQTQKNGDAPFERYLTTAIRSAGGVRPDADLSQIQLIRNGQVNHLNISGIIEGSQFDDVALVAGDQIVIPSLGRTQHELMRPSRITPPGFNIFISNLSKPADSNGQSAVGKHARSIPFGTRLLKGLISANCVGGTISTNASRVAILVSTDLLTGQTRVIQRSIEDLVRNHNRDDFNPYLMPNDGIACYDSNMTNFRDVARSFSDLFNPLSILSNFGERN